MLVLNNVTFPDLDSPGYRTNHPADNTLLLMRRTSLFSMLARTWYMARREAKRGGKPSSCSQ